MLRGAGNFVIATSGAAPREARAAGLGAMGASGGSTIINSDGLGTVLTKTGHDQTRIVTKPA